MYRGVVKSRPVTILLNNVNIIRMGLVDYGAAVHFV
jgi:hypothetical protein